MLCVKHIGVEAGKRMTALFKMEETDREARDDGGACPVRHAPSISRLQSGTSWLADSGRAANRRVRAIGGFAHGEVRHFRFSFPASASSVLRSFQSA